MPFTVISQFTNKSCTSFSLIWDEQINTCFPIWEPVFACMSSLLSQNIVPGTTLQLLSVANSFRLCRMSWLPCALCRMSWLPCALCSMSWLPCALCRMSWLPCALCRMSWLPCTLCRMSWLPCALCSITAFLIVLVEFLWSSLSVELITLHWLNLKEFLSTYL